MHMTKSEQEIMALLWAVDHPMTQAEVVATCENRSWKERSVFSMLNSLIKKGLIREVGFVRSGKTYARTFAASMTQAEYLAQVITERLPQGQIPALFRALLQQDCVTAEMRQELQTILDEACQNR